LAFALWKKLTIPFLSSFCDDAALWTGNWTSRIPQTKKRSEEKVSSE